MSVRALKKREAKFQRRYTTIEHNARDYTGIATDLSASPSAGGYLRQQYESLDRATRSNQEIHQPAAAAGQPAPAQQTNDLSLVQSKSQEDISSTSTALKRSEVVIEHPLSNAKSEVRLYTISTRSCHPSDQPDVGSMQTDSQRDLTGSPAAVQRLDAVARRTSNSTFGAPRRMSESSLYYSQSSGSEHTHSSAAETVLRVPIIGYEVMEERARFTVYKLRVDSPTSQQSWLVIRRYTDFVRLHNKLKQSFPELEAVLPRKKLFGNNFNSAFLDERTRGLQSYINAILARDQIRNCAFVREFFCLDEPPTRSDSMEECRAIFEAQEETIVKLKQQIENKDDLILRLQQELREAFVEKEQLKDTLKNMTLQYTVDQPESAVAESV